MSKDRILIIVGAGVGSGNFNQGVPALNNFINKLSEHYDITLCSFNYISRQPGYRSISPPVWIKSNAIRAIYLMIKILFAHKLKRYNLIHTFYGLPSGYFGVMVKKVTGLPLISTFMGGEVVHVPSINYGALRSRSGIKKIKKILTRSDEVIFLSVYQKDLAFKIYVPKFSHVLPFSYSNDISESASKEFDPPYRLLHIANLTEVKDQFTLIKAFKIMRQQLDCRLKVVGGDYSKGVIQKFAKEQHVEDHIDFVGEIKHHEVLKAMNDAHLMIHSSLFEGMPVVFVEAMSCGLPVTGTNVGLLSDLSGTACLTCPVEDFRGLADNTIQLLTNENVRKKLIKNGLRWSEEHNFDWLMDSYNQIYRSYLK